MHRPASNPRTELAQRLAHKATYVVVAGVVVLGGGGAAVVVTDHEVASDNAARSTEVRFVNDGTVNVYDFIEPVNPDASAPRERAS